MGKHVRSEERRRSRAWDQWLKRLLEEQPSPETASEPIPETETTLDMVLGELIAA